jgi:hypothetical protein
MSQAFDGVTSTKLRTAIKAAKDGEPWKCMQCNDVVVANTVNRDNYRQRLTAGELESMWSLTIERIHSSDCSQTARWRSNNQTLTPCCAMRAAI